MPPRPRRRAVGPPGAQPSRDEPRLGELDGDGEVVQRPPSRDDDERLRAERPPHHDQGV